MATYVRCPHCGTADGLTLREFHEEVGETDPGRHEVKHGGIIPGSVFYFTPGDPIRVELECGGCGHHWRSRRTIA